MSDFVIIYYGFSFLNFPCCLRALPRPPVRGAPPCCGLARASPPFSPPRDRARITPRLPACGVLSLWLLSAPCPALPCAARLPAADSPAHPRLFPRRATAPASPPALPPSEITFVAVICALPRPPVRGAPPARFVGGRSVAGLRSLRCSRSLAPCGRVPPPRGRFGRYPIAPLCFGRFAPSRRSWIAPSPSFRSRFPCPPPLGHRLRFSPAPPSFSGGGNCRGCFRFGRPNGLPFP